MPENGTIPSPLDSLSATPVREESAPEFVATEIPGDLADVGLTEDDRTEIVQEQEQIASSSSRNLQITVNSPNRNVAALVYRFLEVVESKGATKDNAPEQLFFDSDVRELADRIVVESLDFASYIDILRKIQEELGLQNQKSG